MSKINSLTEPLLQLIYSYLKLRDKFTFSLVNRRTHCILYNYPLSDIFFEVDHYDHYFRGMFLFNNVVHIRIMSCTIDNSYLNMFKNLKEVDFSQMEFASFGELKNLVFGLPTSVFIVIVLDNHTKEQFKQAAHIYKRDFTMRIAKNKRQLEESSNSSAVKRIRTPSPATKIFDKQLEALLLSKSRMKYAILSPEDFIPIEIFQKFPKLDTGYKAVINATPFDDNAINSADSVESAIHAIKDLLVHCVVRSQQNNWIFVTQVEAYYHDKNVDDVAQVDRKDKYSQNLVVKLEKCQEGKGSWYELRFKYQKFEVIATGGYYNNNKHNDMLGAYLGVAAPFHMAQDTDFILFSPIIPQETLSCIQSLRNYKKKASLKKWCFKSLFFFEKDFVTPSQLNLHDKEPDNFVSVCSKLLFLAVYDELVEDDFVFLEKKLIRFSYWKSLGFESMASKEDVLKKLKEPKSEKGRMLSKAKKLLIQIILERQIPIKNKQLMILYNEIIYPRVKSINNNRMTKMLE